MSTENNETQKDSFETLCLELVALLDQEYEVAKTGNYQKMHEINKSKAEKQDAFQQYLFDFTLKPKGIPENISDHINAVHDASRRNASYLAGAIDGASTIVRELRRSAEIATFTGLYNADGSFKASEEAQQNLGTV